MLLPNSSLQGLLQHNDRQILLDRQVDGDILAIIYSHIVVAGVAALIKCDILGSLPVVQVVADDEAIILPVEAVFPGYVKFPFCWRHAHLQVFLVA